jgi:ribonuclease J
MQLIIHRGTKEVGGTCVEVSAGNTRIILDVGLPLFDVDRKVIDTWALRSKSTAELAEEGVLPAVAGLFDDGPSPDAILLSHAHLDHSGLLDRSAEDIPIYATTGTSKMLLAGSVFAQQPSIPRDRHRVLSPEIPVQIGDFRVTAFPVDHSIFGCVALLVEADAKSLLYTGDLRLHGRKTGMAKRLVKFFQNRQLDVLLMEGTHFGFGDGERVTEYELEDEIVGHVQDAPGLVLACFSPQHLDRLVGFIRAAIKTGRTFVADAYTAFLLHLISSETDVPVPGKVDGFPVFFPATLWKNEKKRAMLANKCPHMEAARITIDAILAAPSKYLMVFRPSMLEDDFRGKLPDGVQCLHSRWEGYLDEPDWEKTGQQIQQAQGKLVQVHTSGHILSEDIVGLVNSLKPKTVVPVHTFEPEEFARRMGNVRVLSDGEVLQIP